MSEERYSAVIEATPGVIFRWKVFIWDNRYQDEVWYSPDYITRRGAEWAARRALRRYRRAAESSKIEIT
jgi:hypothetical protein